MADSKLTDLTADTAPTSDDLLYLVNDPAGTPVDRKVTVGNLAASAPFSGLYAPLSVAGKLLGSTYYSPASNSTIATRSNATPADADATNLAVTFTAPASGSVYVVLECLANQTVSGQSFYWGLREGTTDLTFSAGGTQMYIADAVNAFRHRVTIPLSGLSAGSHTYKWAISCTTNAGNTTNLFAGDAGYGVAVMQVFAA